MNTGVDWFYFESSEPAMEFAINHNKDAAIPDVVVWVEGSDGIYRNDSVGIDIVDVDNIRVRLLDPANIRVKLAKT